MYEHHGRPSATSMAKSAVFFGKDYGDRTQSLALSSADTCEESRSWTKGSQFLQIRGDASVSSSNLRGHVAPEYPVRQRNMILSTMIQPTLGRML